ncbi:aspartyl-phosphate phosphatase Spo0E family protein [Wukongibacter sp. M2B1]|uniref:aspartyl-phosphate phosphatase Spo0E family protein n=1 Tax=Wukongibacter sp. M2B1 TaxID=3088895 RepID=UPI003D796F84
MEKRQYRNVIKLSNEFELDRKINELRSRLNKALESNIDTREIIDLSQELDEYIVFKQLNFVKRTNEK